MEIHVLLGFMLCSTHATSATTHSLKYFFTGVTAGIDLPEFTAVGLVDDELLEYYDSNMKSVIPKTEWLEKSVDQQYWDERTHRAHDVQQFFQAYIKVLMARFKQTQEDDVICPRQRPSVAVCSDDIIVPGPVSSSHEEHLYSVFEALSLSEGKCVSLHCWLLKEPSSCVRAELEGRLCCVFGFVHSGSQLTGLLSLPALGRQLSLLPQGLTEGLLIALFLYGTLLPPTPPGHSTSVPISCTHTGVVVFCGV
ncbi:hypothetical protein AAFF_G00386630 [Aldrovandia affinis]|uniref:MHC class I-like antigen recognition-like domain-containing protein n=1 Tax=Aldrovandia affinis TaxID=143900 RepID=A0AAD7R438_9TELE|nr:hypothetical protein AAFF_G00386630 [Aldrovandia affinis]